MAGPLAQLLPGRQNLKWVNSAAFHHFITLQQWPGTEGHPPQQWQIQNYVCHVLEKKIEYLKMAHRACSQLAARTWLEISLALQFLVQQRHFMSSIEHVPVVQRSDSSCTGTANLRSDSLKRTTKRGTRGRDRLKKNNKRKADKIIALRCELEGLKAEKSDAQQARRQAEIRAASAEGKAKEYREKFHTFEQKALERDLRAAQSKLCESAFLQESVAASALAPSVNP